MFKAAPDQQRACAEDINRWSRTGQLRPNISHVVPLKEAAAAHRLQEESTVQKTGALAGKIVVVPS
jgi:NADPH:quinone reductase